MWPSARGSSTWRGKPLRLVIDHRNGDWLDNRLENLRFLCPLGAPLARLEASIAFRALFTRFPHMRLAVDRQQLQWSHGDGLVLRGLDRLPVHLQP